jgi:3-hydroxyacyl-CoA dehydrogenase
VSEPVAIVGAGSIGVAWALVFARAGHPVTLHDPDPERLEHAPAELTDRLEGLEEFGLLDESPDAIAARVRTRADLKAAVKDAVHVQECAPESVELKRELFARLDAVCGPAVVLASSSSMLAPSRFASELAGRARVLVAHPGNPPYLLPVVELVPAPFTADAAVDVTETLLTGAGMSPVRVSGEPVGFVFNRLQGAVLREAYCLVRDGVCDVEAVDRVMRDGLARRWSVVGPFESADLNTRGGIAIHAARMGPAYAQMGAERGQDDPWTDALVQRVARERRDQLDLSDWDARVLWRDRALMALQRCRDELAPSASDPLLPLAKEP